MPTLYYQQRDRDRNYLIFGIHGGVFVLVTAWLWGNGFIIAPIVTAVWGAVVALQAWWIAPMNDWVLQDELFRRVDLQSDTYQHLQEKHGEDWDINISVEEFDLVRKQVIAQKKLEHTLRYTGATFLLSLMIWMILLFTQATVFPVGLFMSHIWGIVLVNIVIRMMLHRELGNARQKKHAKRVESNQYQASGMNLQGQYVIGDDGELLEVTKAKS